MQRISKQINKTKNTHQNVPYEIVVRVEIQNKNFLEGLVALEQGVMVLS